MTAIVHGADWYPSLFLLVASIGCILAPVLVKPKRQTTATKALERAHRRVVADNYQRSAK